MTNFNKAFRALTIHIAQVSLQCERVVKPTTVIINDPRTFFGSHLGRSATLCRGFESTIPNKFSSSVTLELRAEISRHILPIIVSVGIHLHCITLFTPDFNLAFAINHSHKSFNHRTPTGRTLRTA